MQTQCGIAAVSLVESVCCSTDKTYKQRVFYSSVNIFNNILLILLSSLMISMTNYLNKCNLEIPSNKMY